MYESVIFVHDPVHQVDFLTNPQDTDVIPSLGPGGSRPSTILSIFSILLAASCRAVYGRVNSPARRQNPNRATPAFLLYYIPCLPLIHLPTCPLPCCEPAPA